ncbi:DUF3307 domain-containing protein [Alicyclobacillus sp. SO9]|uniref:DUF3307 domain-containing protein n=1 Tax=Alicyclobacillus sp. SO9 TaxID=2665646 RepID=UPI0018E76596|nr:DUF3307 domain-containing protein [Alicyclobacillus sp. SO9]QQE77705.1 DUF3307 domain-containing protein [Alicyclobacillus sp. SO9]
MVVLLLIFAHLLSDFVFQTSTMAAKKGLFKRHFWLHIGIHFVTYEAALLVFSYLLHAFYLKFLLAGIYLAGLHLLIDFAKEKSQDTFPKWDTKVRKSLVFFVDQALHLISLLLISRFTLQYQYTRHLHQIAEKVLRHHGFSLNLEQSVILILILMVLSTSFSGIVVELIVSPVPQEGERLIETKHIARESNTQGTRSYGSQDAASVERTYISVPPATVSRGRLIGYLERLMTMLLIAAAGYSSIGFIIATKSLVRFRQLDDRDFAEYFLIGTFSSILLGTIWGFVLKTFLT